MLRLHDFYHLPPVAEYVRQWVDEPSSLALICGLDPQPTQSQRTVPSQRFSGRVTVFRLMVNEFLAGHPGAVCMMITEDRQLSRFARQFRDQAEVLLVDGSTTYEDHVAAALEQGPDLLVIDPLSAFTLPPMMIAVEAGLNVLSQIDVPYRGSAVFHQLAEWGLPSEGLGQTLSLISVQHVHGLCPHCRQPATIQPEHWMQLTRRYPDLDQNLKHLTRASGPTESGFFFESRGCPTCQETGYIGEKLVFDFLRVETPLLPPYQYRSQLMMSDYLLQLAKEGVLSLTD
ncbi:MAG: hypothetical protein GYB66_03630 [Chloroflexi bacterium]|nr:hypothetical protein [Chloroflexota bacterium]